MLWQLLAVTLVLSGILCIDGFRLPFSIQEDRSHLVRYEREVPEHLWNTTDDDVTTEEVEAPEEKVIITHRKDDDWKRANNERNETVHDKSDTDASDLFHTDLSNNSEYLTKRLNPQLHEIPAIILTRFQLLKKSVSDYLELRDKHKMLSGTTTEEVITSTENYTSGELTSTTNLFSSGDETKRQHVPESDFKDQPYNLQRQYSNKLLQAHDSFVASQYILGINETDPPYWSNGGFQLFQPFLPHEPSLPEDVSTKDTEGPQDEVGLQDELISLVETSLLKNDTLDKLIASEDDTDLSRSDFRIPRDPLLPDTDIVSVELPQQGHDISIPNEPRTLDDSITNHDRQSYHDEAESAEIASPEEARVEASQNGEAMIIKQGFGEGASLEADL